MRRGKFITFEGIEGAGKSTNINLLAEYIEGIGHDVMVTREPGGTDLGEKIRSVLLDSDQGSIEPLTELFLMFSARVQHLEEKIKPALEIGTWVLCDRFTDSSIAYQGAGRGLGIGFVSSLATLALNDFVPDLTIILDIDPEEGLQRAALKGKADRFEKESLDFFRAVRHAFIEMAKKDRRFFLMNGSLSIQKIQDELRSVIGARLE